MVTDTREDTTMTNSQNLQEFLTLLAQWPLDDIIVGGYLDRGSGIAEGLLPTNRAGWFHFHPMWDSVYFEIRNQLYIMETIEQYSRLHIARVERIEPRFAVDPDDIFGFGSVFRPLVRSGQGPLQIVRVDIYRMSNHSSGSTIDNSVGAIRLCGASDYIFIDGVNVEGIHVAGDASRAAWEDYFDGKYSREEIDLSTLPQL